MCKLILYALLSYVVFFLICFLAQQRFKYLELQNAVMKVPCTCHLENNATNCTKPEGSLCDLLDSQHIKVNLRHASDLAVILNDLYKNAELETQPNGLMTASKSSNYLPKIDYRVVYDFARLFSLKLSYNNLTVFKNTYYSINEIKYLDTLDLSYNNITKVDFKGYQTHNYQLQLLNLGHNRIRHLWGILSVYSINLNNNHLETISNNFFENVTDLEYLNIQGNNLYKFDNQSFKHLLDLKSLTASYNNLVEIHSDTFLKLDKLLDLNLRFNNLSKLDSNLFSSLSNLKTLRLFNNNFKVINNLFDPLTKLKLLDLSHNKISSLFTNIFFLPKLWNLLINDNQLKFLDIDNTLKSTELSVLYLNNNLFNCTHLSDIVETCLQKHIFVKPTELLFITNDYFPKECNISDYHISRKDEYDSSLKRTVVLMIVVAAIIVAIACISANATSSEEIPAIKEYELWEIK